MQPKLISQTGLKVRTNCRLGYYSFGPTEPGETLTEAESRNDTCLRDRDKRSLECFLVGWPQKNKYWPYCDGNMNGKELDRCMATVWGPDDLKTYRSQGIGGGPYNSPAGDTCFNQFYDRYKNQGWAIDQNKAEWENCLIASKV